MGYYELDDKQVLVHFIRDNNSSQVYVATYTNAPDIPLIEGTEVEFFGTSTDFPLLIIDRVLE